MHDNRHQLYLDYLRNLWLEGTMNSSITEHEKFLHTKEFNNPSQALPIYTRST